MEDASEIEKIKELENSILQELYTISPGIEPDNTVELDYEDAVKTYNYTPETFLELAESPQFVHDVLTNANYNWKIPVDIRDYSGVFHVCSTCSQLHNYKKEGGRQ